MADELDPVEQIFTADTAEYEEWLESAAMSAQEFAAANDEAKHAVDELTGSAEESGGVLSFTAGEWLEAAEAAAEIRDNAAEAAAAVSDESDEAAGATAANQALAARPDPKGATISASNGSSRARAGSSRPG